MKRIIIICVFLLATSISSYAQGRTVERTYIATDKDVYVAGESVRCSAFCLNVKGESLFSKMSSIVYLELHSSSGLAATAKIALLQGRGGGSLALPATLPTGNYRLVAYTAQNLNEEGYDFDSCFSKIISVYNVFSKERVKDGVKIVAEDEYAKYVAEVPDKKSSGRVAISAPSSVAVGEDVEIEFAAVSGKSYVSVSVFETDALPSCSGITMADFIESAGAVGDVSFRRNVIPEYDGEIIYGSIIGFDPSMMESVVGKYAFISSPGSVSDIYVSSVGNDGTLCFVTDNIMGDKDLVCEVEGVDSVQNCHLELSLPFVNAEVGAPPALDICASTYDALASRSTAMQIERSFNSDTLYDYLSIRDNLSLVSDKVRYNLDDFTRFPLMEEVFVEFIPQIRARRRDDGSRDIQVRLEDTYKLSGFSKNSSLMLLDGVPVFDHEKIYKYDPALVHYIDIYPGVIYIGQRQYDGIVNFVTYKGNMPAMTFGDNVRVVNWQGASYPVSFGFGREAGPGYPDYRKTIAWNPLLEIEGGSKLNLHLNAPHYKGSFLIVVEGLTAEGQPVYECRSFDVK